MPRGIRFFLKVFCFFIALGLVAGALLLGAAAYFNMPPERNSAEDTLLFEVKRGESADSVGRRLEDLGVIRNRYFWYLLFRLDGEYIKAGSYVIGLPASQTEIRSILTAGEQLLVRVTVPEGVTLKKTALILEEAGICGAEDFIGAACSREILDAYAVPGNSMEGYLYPDTYLFPLSYPAAKVVVSMADNFFRHVQAIAGEPGEPGSLSMDELNKRIIIASIVEREYRVPEEAAVMAGVFFNRLKIGMALQSCATVEYIITEIQGRPHPEVLYTRDIEIKDPYNTYLRPGLPPGPISAPGETALKAAFSPEQTDYLYFRLVDPATGKHYFSRTLDDHIRAASLYVKGS